MSFNLLLAYGNITIFAPAFNQKIILMANIKGSKKRAELADVRRTSNRFNKKTARTAIARLREITDKTDADTFLKKVNSLVDRLAKKNTWHKNKAANLKSKLTKHVNGLK